MAQGADVPAFSPAMLSRLVPCRLTLPSPGVSDGGMTYQPLDPGSIF